MKRNIWAKIFFWGYPAVSIILLFIISSDVIENWFTELLSFGAPLLILGNVLMLISAIVFTRKLKFFIFPLIVILASWEPITETFAFNFERKQGESDFTVMSYNVATFNTERMQNKTSDKHINENIYQWFKQNKSPDILCMQEFYHSDQEDYDNTLDSILKLGGYRYFYMNPMYNDEFKGLFGVITFSKFKAIKSGEIKYGESFFNKGTYHDFKIKNDTVRVLNFHLNSMSIRWNSSDTLSLLDRISYNAKDIYKKLKDGYFQRKVELNEIEKFLDESPYKTIICADMNSIPYSYTYQRLKSQYGNAFEEGGFGLGFTCNRFPWFIRIDNQFYDKRLTVDYFETHSEMKNSDHYPIEAGYSFQQK